MLFLLSQGGRTSQHTGKAVTVELFLTGLPRLSGGAEGNLQRIIKVLKYSFNRVLLSKGLPLTADNFDEEE